MERIHFENLSGDWKVIGVMIIALAFLLAGAFELIEFENMRINNYLTITGFLLLVIYHSKMFWYKNYVQWNKRGIVIRIKSFFGKSLKFNQIKSADITEENLIISKMDGDIVLIDLSEIVESDSQKLNEIIAINIAADNI